MKQFYKTILFSLFFLPVVADQEIMIHLTNNPDISACWSLFSRFGNCVCLPSDNLDQLLQQKFEKEIALCADNPEDMIFLQAMFMDELIGYLVLQVIGEDEVFVHQVAIDPEKYDRELIKELLFAIFEIMPQIKHLSVQIPAQSADLVSLFEYLGFVRRAQALIDQATELFVVYDLLVHPKCKICEILYGADFWQHDMDPKEGDWGSWQLQEIEPQDYENDWE